MTCTTTETDGQYPTKDPNAVLDYQTNWTTWLAEDETIATSEWIIELPDEDAAPLTKNSATNSTNTATIWLSGGTLGVTYVVVNRITTNQGRIEDRTKYVTIEQH